MRRGNWLRLLQAANPNQWYVYRSMGQTYLQNQNDRYRLNTATPSGWEHQSRVRDGRWLTDTQMAKEAREEARRMGWIW